MKIIESNTTGGAFSGIVSELKKNMANGGEHIIIVPDRFSMSVEKTILKALGKTALFNVEVMTFTRLAEKMLKGKIKRCLTPEGAVMMLQKTVGQNADKLVYYKKSVKKSGFANDLYASLTELRNSGITPNALLEKLDKLPKSMRGKIADTAFLYQCYLDELGKNFTDSSTRLEALAAELSETKLFQKNVYITDFYDFKDAEFKIITELNRCALSLSVGVVEGSANENARIYPQRILRKLLQASTVVGGVETAFFMQPLDAPFKAMGGWLYSYDTPHRISAKNKIRMFKSPDVFGEVENIAVNIKKLVTESGLRFMDIAVAVPDLDCFAPFFKSAFKRHGIPFFIDKQELLVEQTKARFLLAALNAVATDFSADAVFEFVKNPLFDAQTYNFENYCVAYGVDRSRFFSPFTADFVGGAGENLTEDAENARLRFVELISDFNGAGFTAAQFVEKLKSLEEKTAEAWEDYKTKLNAESAFYAKCLEQVDKKTDMIFDEICQVFGDVEFTAEAFYDMFKSMLSTLKIALLPLYIDCVFVGDVHDSKYGDVDALFLAGAVEGKLPRQSDGGKILTERDEELLKSADVEVFPTAREKNLLGMFEVVELLKKPKKLLFVSYHQTGADGKPERPSTLLLQLSDLFFDGEDFSTPLKIESTADSEFALLHSFGGESAKEFAYMLSSAENCFFNVLDKAVAGGLDTVFMQPFDAAYSFLNDSQKKRIAKLYEKTEYVDPSVFEKPNRAGHTSASELEKYYQCPYQHFLKYGLELKVREEANLLNNETGTIIHAVLERFFRLKDLKKEDVRSAVENIFESVISTDRFRTLAAGSASRLTVRRLKAECVRFCSELFELQEHSLFKPYLLETRFGESKSENGAAPTVLIPLTLCADGKKTALVGTIDRVDKWGNYIAVIDYKSFKNIDLTVKNIYFGVKIQLYLYLLALLKNFDVKPAGVFYLPIYDGYVAEDKADGRYRYVGQVLNDLDVVCALDSRFCGDPKNSLVPADFKKDKLGGTNVVRSEDFETLSEVALAAAQQGLKEIYAGYIAPKPLDGACDKCDYNGICAHKKQNERKLGSVTLADVCGNEKEDE